MTMLYLQRTSILIGARAALLKVRRDGLQVARLRGFLPWLPITRQRGGVPLIRRQNNRGRFWDLFLLRPVMPLARIS